MWTKAVYGNAPGEPCYNANEAASWCQQAWRWNLDAVVDPSRNVTNFFYQEERNWYKSLGPYYSPSHDDPLNLIRPYVRSGYLKQISYGGRYRDVALSLGSFDILRTLEIGTEAYESDRPRLYVPQATMPHIYEGTLRAIFKGKSPILTMGPKELDKINRPLALAGWVRKEIPGCPECTSPDEYPHAFTLNGGTGAHIWQVPEVEQRRQGASITNLKARVAPFQQFLVVPVSRAGETLW